MLFSVYVENQYYIENQRQKLNRDRESAKLKINAEKQATKNVQLVLRLCCKTWCALYHPRKQPWKLICCMAGQNVGDKTRNIATALFNLFCSNLAKQVALFLLPVLPQLQAGPYFIERNVMLISENNSFQSLTLGSAHVKQDEPSDVFVVGRYLMFLRLFPNLTPSLIVAK